MMSLQARYILFPYTTLFRSLRAARVTRGHGAGVSPSRRDEGTRMSAPHIAAERLGADYFQDPYSRSEEHTSELQSHVNLVCRLLLEKKNNVTRTKDPIPHIS